MIELRFCNWQTCALELDDQGNITSGNKIETEDGTLKATHTKDKEGDWGQVYTFTE